MAKPRAEGASYFEMFKLELELKIKKKKLPSC